MIIDSISDSNSADYFITIMLIFFAVQIFGLIINFCFTVYSKFISESITIDVTDNVYSSILLKKKSFWSSFNPKDILTRMTQDILSIKNVTIDFLSSILFQLFSFLGTFFIIGYYSLEAAALIIIGSAFVFIITFKGAHLLDPLSLSIRQLSSKFTDIFGISIDKIREVYSWKITSLFISKYRDTASQMRNKQTSLVANLQLINSLLSLSSFMFSSFLLLLLLKGNLEEGTISIGQLMSILVYSGGAIESINSIANLFVANNIDFKSTDRVLEILNHQYDIKPEKSLLIKHPYFQKSFQDGVSLPEQNEFILYIYSENGCGKSTLADILTGFDDLSSTNLAQQWLTVSSNTILFEGKLLKNLQILSKKDELTGNQIIETLRANNFSSLLDSLSIDLNEMIPNYGQGLSQGQRQKIGLIAMILKDPENVVLDESFNSIDEITMDLIKDPLIKFLKSRKSILIDHSGKLLSKKDKNDPKILFLNEN
jgi:ABC-type bacteriocin/lantibiotic exporter with double-glycine peptidase domain